MPQNEPVSMSDSGLVDWSRPCADPLLQSYFVYGDQRRILALPQSIDLGHDASGQPDLRLALVRSSGPGLTDESYAHLQMRLCANYFLNESVAAGHAANGALAPAPIRGGAMVFRPAAALEIPEELLAPLALDWNALGASRISFRLSAAAGAVLRQAIINGALMFGATAEIEIAGVSPTFSCNVNFDSRKLLAKIKTLADGAGRVARDDLVSMFDHDLTALPLKFSTTLDGVDRKTLATALVDRIRLLWGAPPSTPRADNKPAIQLADGLVPALETASWDLSLPEVAMRSFVLTFDPLGAARELAAKGAADALVVEADVPPLATGFYRIALNANIPAPRLGYSSVTASLRFPPHPPARNFEVRKSVILVPPEDTGSIDIRIAPNEQLNWQVSTSVMIARPGGVQRLSSPEKGVRGSRTLLTRDDFAAEFLEFEMGQALARLASVHGEITGTRQGELWSTSFALTANSPRGAVAVPRDLGSSILNLQLLSLQGGQSMNLAPQAACDYKLDLHNTPGYGAQSVTVSCAFVDGERQAAIELRGEAAAESDAEIIAFTPENAVREWHWLSRSPFHSGCMWRWHESGDAPPQAWVGPVPFATHLQIDTRTKGPI